MFSDCLMTDVCCTSAGADQVKYVVNFNSTQNEDQRQNWTKIKTVLRKKSTLRLIVSD
jgi:hypothetical protein